MKKHLLAVATTAGLLFTAFSGNASAHELTYKVQSGDTLWKIASANGITVTNLKTWNNLTSDSIYVNQTLTLLAPHTHETAATYIVKSGDTLWIISKNTGVSIDQIKTINGLTTDNIYVGQVLKLTADTTTAPISKVDTLVTEAKKYIGTPYVWGGSTPSGFDCSGYLGYVYTKVGVSLPRTVADIWNYTKTVTTPNVGDIVFFKTISSGPSHAGIYLGNNKFIHAGSSTGVTISDMTSSYWGPIYLGAKTPF